MKKNPKFNKLLTFIKDKPDSQYVAEKSSPQTPSSVKLNTEEAAKKIVKTRNSLKRQKMPVKPGNLYDEL